MVKSNGWRAMNWEQRLIEWLVDNSSVFTQIQDVVLYSPELQAKIFWELPGPTVTRSRGGKLSLAKPGRIDLTEVKHGLYSPHASVLCPLLMYL